MRDCVYRLESTHLLCLFPVSVLHCDVLGPELLFIPVTPGPATEHATSAWARVLLLAPVSRIPVLKVITFLVLKMCVNLHISDIVYTALSDGKMNLFTTVKISRLSGKKCLVHCCINVTSAFLTAIIACICAITGSSSIGWV